LTRCALRRAKRLDVGRRTAALLDVWIAGEDEFVDADPPVAE